MERKYYLQHGFPPGIVLEQCNLSPQEFQMQIPSLDLLPQDTNSPLQIVQCRALQNENDAFGGWFFTK